MLKPNLVNIPNIFSSGRYYIVLKQLQIGVTISNVIEGKKSYDTDVLEL